MALLTGRMSHSECNTSSPCHNQRNSQTCLCQPCAWWYCLLEIHKLDKPPGYWNLKFSHSVDHFTHLPIFHICRKLVAITILYCQKLASDSFFQFKRYYICIWNGYNDACWVLWKGIIMSHLIKANKAE